MLESAVLLRKVISWDEKDVAKTVEWLAKQQLEDGSFVEDADDVVQHVMKFSLNFK